MESSDRQVIVVLGARGMLGSALMRQWEAESCVDCHGFDIEDVDIADEGLVSKLLDRIKPALVINAAAYTNVDGCESHQDLAFRVNADGPKHLANWCRRHDAKLVHIGTDFIFDGRSDRPYTPDDPPNPISTYGQSKWQGEVAVRESGCQHLIVRTSWLFGPNGRNFVDRIIERAERGGPLRVVTDQVGRPSFTDDMAMALFRLVCAGASGIVHFANEGVCSWHEFACEIVQWIGADVPIERIIAAELALPASRPGYSVLDTSEYTRITGERPTHWKDALSRYLSVRGEANMRSGSTRRPTEHTKS